MLAVIAAGGALGSLARWGIAMAIPHSPGSYPVATFLTNAAGSFLLGVLMTLISDVAPPSKYLRPFAGVGVLGGFTTFSTYMLDTRGLLATGHVAMAGAYLAGTLLAGLAAISAGGALARSAIRVSRRRSHRDTERDHLAAAPGTPGAGPGPRGGAGPAQAGGPSPARRPR